MRYAGKKSNNETLNYCIVFICLIMSLLNYLQKSKNSCLNNDFNVNFVWTTKDCCCL